MIKVKFSKRFTAIQNRIKKLPTITIDTINAILLKDARGLISEWHTGIKFRRLNLEKLAEVTWRSKKAKGLPKPRTALYGKGENDPDSYINMLQLRKTLKGWRVNIKRGNHRSGVSFKTIFMIHEHGATIIGKARNGQPTTIVIPPRSALDNSFKRWLRKRSKIDNASLVKQAITNFLNTGRNDLLEKLKQENAIERSPI